MNSNFPRCHSTERVVSAPAPLKSLRLKLGWNCVHVLSTFASSRTALATTAGGAGGAVLVATNNSGQTKVITVTDQTINVSSPSGTLKLTAAAPNGVGQTPTGLLGWFFRNSGHEY